jgi:Leucine-rich repeat (LRR) protein
MAKTRRVKTKRFYGGNQYGPDTAKLMSEIDEMETGGILHLRGLNITSLPPLSPEISELELSNTQITSLPELPSNLELLDVSRTPLTSLPELPPTLTYLDVSNTRITSLPELPPNLESLYVSNTQITSLPELPPNLKNLNVSRTRLTTLPELPPNLENLNVSNTRLTTLPELPLTLGLLSVSGTSIPKKQRGETIAQYNTRIREIYDTRVKARDLAAAQQTVFRPGTEEDSPALRKLRNTDILERDITPFLTGMSGEKSTILPARKPTAMQQLKKKVTGSYNGGRTKKNKRA